MKLLKKYLLNRKLKDVFSDMTKVVLVIYLIMGLAFLGIHENFIKLKDDVDKNMECIQAIDAMNVGSDLLTEYARRFVVVGDRNSLQAYYDEVMVINKRHKAINTLEELSDTDISPMLVAEQHSNTLTHDEIYAMKLAARARNTNYDKQLDKMYLVELTDEDLSLPNDDMLEKAITMIYSSDYASRKILIHKYTNETMQAFKQKVAKEKEHSSSTYNAMINFLFVGLLISLLLNLSEVWLSRRLMAGPIEKFVQNIARNEPFYVDRDIAAELQILTDAYNEQFYRNQKHQARLFHKANYDALTEVLNRGVFTEMLHNIEAAGKGALIIIDVDKFKTINDRYGHATGDLLLKRIATLLHTYFWATNMHVARYGGDEFTVLVTGIAGDTTALRKRIVKTATILNNILQHGGDQELPRSSLSIGVAFSEDIPMGDSKTLFECADAALYEVKCNGRANIKIYEPKR